MRQFTQTLLATAENGWHGNCWQTAVACLLDVEPEALPAQAGCDGDGEPSYRNRLQAYLRHHHGLGYVELIAPEEILTVIRTDGYHLMTGTTVRSSPENRGMRHVVVGHAGIWVWDPHPSRAGLLAEVRWAFLVPFPRSWAPYYDRLPEGERLRCECPTCGGRA